jgi:hypothetical protein
MVENQLFPGLLQRKINGLSVKNGVFSKKPVVPIMLRPAF